MKVFRRSCTAAPSGWSHFLTEALVDLGHDVTLFASGDSITRAELVPCVPTRAAAGPRCADPVGPPRRDDGAGVRARRRLRRDPLPHRLPAIPLARRQRRPARHDACTAGWTCRTSRRSSARSRTCRWCRSRTRSASRMPRRQLAGDGAPRPAARPVPPVTRRAGATWRSSAGSRPRSGVDRAIEIARRAGMPLRIAAKVDRKDRDVLRDARSNRCSTIRWSSYMGEIGEHGEERVPGRRARRCCSRSTGPSRSGWS